VTRRDDSNDRQRLIESLAEVRSFGTLLGFGLYYLSIICVYVLWDIGALSPTISVPVCLVVAVIAAWWWRRRDRDLADRILRVGQHEGDELTAALQPVEEWLRLYSGTSNARLIATPDPAILVRAIRSRSPGVVVMSSGFWRTCKNQPVIVEAAIAAVASALEPGDIEQQTRLSRWTWVVTIQVAMTLLWLGVLRPAGGLRPAAAVVVGVVCVGFSKWGFDREREARADRFTLLALGERQRVEDLRSLLTRNRRQSLHQSALSPWFKLVLAARSRLHGGGARLHPRSQIASDAILGAIIGLWLAITAVTFALLAKNIPEGLTSQADESAAAWVKFFAAWCAYQFAWRRHRRYGGRTLIALGRNLTRMACFFVPLMGFALVEPLILHALFPAAASQPQAEEFVLLVLILLTGFLLVWSAARLALLSRKERARTRPGPIRSALCCVAVFFLMLLLPANWSRPAMLFVMGAVLHFAARPESGLAPNLPRILDDRRRNSSREADEPDRINVVVTPFVRVARLFAGWSSTWLTFVVVGSSFLIGLAWIGIVLPAWTLNVVNPIAWLASLVGIPASGVWISALDKIITLLPVTAGIPVLGAMIIWFLVSWWPQQLRTVHLLLVVLPGCLAYQLTVQRAYIYVTRALNQKDKPAAAAAAKDVAAYLAVRTGQRVTGYVQQEEHSGLSRSAPVTAAR
jgi:hypothetical protein